MKSRKPYHISRDRVVVSFCLEHYRDLLPTEIQKLSKLSRPTVFNVLKYFKERGIVEQYGKRYRLTPFKSDKQQEPLKPLEGYWRYAYNESLKRYSEKYGVSIDMIPGWWKDMVDARMRNEAYFLKAWGRERMLKDKPGQKSASAFVTKNRPIKKGISEWENAQYELLRKLRKQ
jgi:hypothetical protein